MSNDAIVQKLWALSNILRDDGITFHQYVNELSYLLFLKMAHETDTESGIPTGFRWFDLARLNGEEQFKFYRAQLVVLGNEGDENIRAVFANPTSMLQRASSLNTLVAKISLVDWYSAKKEGLGDLYEGILEKNASEKKSGAGQYFTPRALIESIVHVTQPRTTEMIQDPAAGTGGFLVVANEYARSTGRTSQGGPRFIGVELVQDTHRLLLMNAILHGMNGSFILGDSLSTECEGRFPAADLILTNPPFGNKRGGGLPTRRDLPLATTNKQLAFLQLVYLSLAERGRAAVVVPDSVLFEGNTGQAVRNDLMKKCNLHTILRLPDGIFYANVTTNVLFFNRDLRGTNATWIYDMRTNMPSYGKRTPLRRDEFREFEEAFGPKPDGSAKRIDGGPRGRFRCFTRDEIERRGNDLDIFWLEERQKRQNIASAEPEELAAEIRLRLEAALDDLEQLTEQIAAENLEANG